MSVYSSISGYDPAGSFVTVPGTQLGAGHRVNLNRPLAASLMIVPVLSAGQWVDISEVRGWLSGTVATRQLGGSPPSRIVAGHPFCSA